MVNGPNSTNFFLSWESDLWVAKRATPPPPDTESTIAFEIETRSSYIS